MSYHNQSRRRGNGYGIIITGYGGDAHYDHLGQDSYDAERIRADNLRLMDEDMMMAEQTVTARVPLDEMERAVELQDAQIEADVSRIKAELDATSIVNEDGMLRFPVDPGRNPELVSADIPTMPSEIDAAATAARDLERQAITYDLNAARAEEFRAADVTSPGDPVLIQRTMEEAEMRADDISVQRESLAVLKAREAAAVVQSAPVLQPKAPQLTIQQQATLWLQEALQYKAQGGTVSPPPPHLQAAVNALMQQKGMLPTAAPSGTTQTTYQSKAPPAGPTTAPMSTSQAIAPPLQPVNQYQAQAPKKASVMPIVGAGLLALMFFRK